MDNINALILFVSLILLFCIAFSRFLTKAGIPVLVFFIFAGMIMGSDGVGGIYFDNAVVASTIGNFAICYILFAGGMATSWKSAKEVLAPGVLLSTVGVLITAVFVAVAAYFLVGLTWLQGLLLGAVVSCTDAASVFSILRSNNLNLKAPLAPLLELESGSNDPTAYMLTIAIISLMTAPDSGFLSFVMMFVVQFSVGGVLGFAFGFAGAWVTNRIKLNSDGLYPVVAATIAALIYSAVQIMHGNGFLGIYVAGMVMGNVKLAHKVSLVRFFDGFSWLMQILVFVTLGLLVFPSQLPSVWLPAITISVMLMFVIRPAAVFLTLLPFKYPRNARLLISWVGLRGASSIVFASYALSNSLPNADVIFNMVFFISLTSVILQGSLLAPVASLLDQLDREDKTLVSRGFTDYEEELQGTLYELRAVKGSPAVGMAVQEMKFPESVRIMLISRGSGTLTPTGKTRIKEGDMLMVTAENTGVLLALKERLGLA